MKLPAMFYGPPGRTALRVRKFAKGLVERGDFVQYDPGPFIDTADNGGLILANEESWRTDAENFRCYLLPDEIAAASVQSAIRDNMHAWLMGSLQDGWRFMSTLGGLSWLGLQGRDRACALRYVHAAVEHWPAMNAERPRFGPPRGDENNVLLIWTTLFFALDILGLSASERMKIPGRTPRALLDLVERPERSST
jgi:hypothetical protein